MYTINRGTTEGVGNRGVGCCERSVTDHLGNVNRPVHIRYDAVCIRNGRLLTEMESCPYCLPCPRLSTLPCPRLSALPCPTLSAPVRALCTCMSRPVHTLSTCLYAPLHIPSAAYPHLKTHPSAYMFFQAWPPLTPLEVSGGRPISKSLHQFEI